MGLVSLPQDLIRGSVVSPGYRASARASTLLRVVSFNPIYYGCWDPRGGATAETPRATAETPAATAETPRAVSDEIGFCYAWNSFDATGQLWCVLCHHAPTCRRRSSPRQVDIFRVLGTPPPAQAPSASLPLGAATHAGVSRHPESWSPVTDANGGILVNQWPP